MLVTNQLARGFQGAWWGAPRGATNRHHVSRAGPSYDNTFFFFFCMCFVLVWFFEFCLVFLRYSRKKKLFFSREAYHVKSTVVLSREAQLFFHVKFRCAFQKVKKHEMCFYVKHSCIFGFFGFWFFFSFLFSIFSGKFVQTY